MRPGSTGGERGEESFSWRAFFIVSDLTIIIISTAYARRVSAPEKGIPRQPRGQSLSEIQGKPPIGKRVPNAGGSGPWRFQNATRRDSRPNSRLWRRGELNPCPRSYQRKLLHV